MYLLMTDRYVNRIIRDDITYYAEYIWRGVTSGKDRDSKGKYFPIAKEGQHFGDKKKMVNLLTLAHKILIDLNDYVKFPESTDCPICGTKNVDKKKFIFMDRIWSDGAIHYINKHNIEPSSGFKEFIYNDMMKNLESKLARSIDSGIFCDSSKENKDRKKARSLEGKKPFIKCRKLQRTIKDVILKKVMINNEEYVKLEKNKILILDALMTSGGRFKKYIDPYNDKVKRYSEHAGFLDFENGNLQKIVVSGQTDRIDEGDDEIFLPKDMEEMLEYEYIFHTHPPTPKPGGRASVGILYEFPSMGDIFHFIDHYNEGHVIGSLVIAPEGLYNIRRYIDKEEELKKISATMARTDTDEYDELFIDESKLYEEYRKIFKKIQADAIQKYGAEFDTNTFYSAIAQDTSYLGRFNRVLNRYQINIDYYPRKKDGKYWYIDTVFLKFRYYYETEQIKE
jgi:hypothetical protein